MNFIGSEARKRAKFLDSVVAETERCLAFESMRGSFGDSEILSWIHKNLAKLYVPDNKQGVLSVPKSKAQAGIAIVPLRVGERLRLGAGFNEMTEVQKSRAAQVLASLKASKGVGKSISDAFSSDHAGPEVTETGETLGLTTGNVVWIHEPDNPNFGKDKSRLVFGRPLLALVTQPGAHESAELHYGATLIHELDHRRQREMAPIKPGNLQRLNDVRLEDELYAYYAGARYEQGLYLSEDPSYARNNTILNNTIVARIHDANIVNPKDPFKPTGTLKKALA